MKIISREHRSRTNLLPACRIHVSPPTLFHPFLHDISILSSLLMRLLRDFPSFHRLRSDRSRLEGDVQWQVTGIALLSYQEEKSIERVNEIRQ